MNQITETDQTEQSEHEELITREEKGVIDSTDTYIDATKELELKFAHMLELHAEFTEYFRGLSPLRDNYIRLEIDGSGFGPADPRIHVFYGTGATFDSYSFQELLSAIAAHDPEKVRLEKISKLKADLAALEGVAA